MAVYVGGILLEFLMLAAESGDWNAGGGSELTALYNILNYDLAIIVCTKELKSIT